METVKSLSPARRAEMSFPDAMNAVICGQWITKREWDDPDTYGLLHDGFLMLHKSDGTYHQWIVNDGDLLGTDWVIVATAMAVS